jgi:hypothetical protein
MGAFTIEQLNNMAAAALDFNIKGKALDQIVQEKPLLKALKERQKTFPGGKEFITGPVKGTRTSEVQGYTNDDTVTYKNPNNLKRWQYKWYELHLGISVPFTELKVDGITIVDSAIGSRTVEHSQTDVVRLTGILEDKIDDMNQGWAESFNLMLWKDGTQDSKAVPGLQALLSETPTTGTVGGIDRAANDWWRNRVSLGVDVSTPSNLNLVNTLQKEFRQLRRYMGGKPTHFFAGSDFLDALEKELRSKGDFTQDGWAKSKRIDLSVADLAFKGMEIVYDPTLDDLGKAKYGYVLDLNNIRLMPMENEDMRLHNPARPEDRYVLYRAMTWTGGLVGKMFRSSGIYSIA